MRLLFIQGGSRWKFDNVGNVYTDANFNDSVWDRYREYCDKLIVILRREPGVYVYQEAKEKFNKFDTTISECIALPDVYRPIKNALNLKIRKEIDYTIKQQIENAEAVIIRSIGTYYTNVALKWVRKMNKPYLVEETGFSFEALWYHSFHGKFVALQNELSTRHLMKDVPWAIYVTNEALQKRYPCSGRSIGCSDVQVQVDPQVLEKRLRKIENRMDKVILGTAAFLDVGWKGQKYVIRALGKLKKQGYNNFEYQLIGSGTGEALLEEAKNANVLENIKILGTLPHEQVYGWLDNIDIYIQSSFMEGLCRSIIEAMSRACPVICSDVGGNYELVDNDSMFEKGNVDQIAEKILFISNNSKQKEKAKKNFEKSKNYSVDILDKRRDKFYSEFIKSI